MAISAETYVRVALEDGDQQWELDRDQMRCKPPYTVAHAWALSSLHRELVLQLDDRRHSVSSNGTRLRTASVCYYVPDILVIPRSLVDKALQERAQEFEVYDEPMPLVVEVWPPFHGDYDVEVKLAAYQQRGDREIWRVHPYERTLTAWCLQPDGRYSETVYHEGIVEPVALPCVRIALAALFA